MNLQDHLNEAIEPAPKADALAQVWADTFDMLLEWLDAARGRHPLRLDSKLYDDSVR